MEVCKHSVYNIKLITRVHKNTGRRGSGVYPDIIIAWLSTRINYRFCRTFQSSYTCSSNRKNGSSLFFCQIYFLCSFQGDCVPLFVHLVIFNFIFTHRKKSSKTNVKGYKSSFNSLVRKAFEHFFRKVKASCRAGRRAGISCINILIAF